MIKFDQAYWYTHECPLRELNIPVIPETDGESKIREYVHTTLVNMFDSNIMYSPIKLIKKLNISVEKRGVGVNVFTRRIILQ